MGNQNPGDSDNDAPRSDETLTPKTAHKLYNVQEMKQTEIADMFGITQPRVSKLASDYQDAVKEGKSQADPSDFDEADLRAALGDKEPMDNPFDSVDCPRCGKAITKSEAPKSAGIHDCPHCDNPIEWAEDEIVE